MTEDNKKKVELLLPAGGLDTLVTAVQYGADASRRDQQRAHDIHAREQHEYGSQQHVPVFEQVLEALFDYIQKGSELTHRLHRLSPRRRLR